MNTKERLLADLKQRINDTRALCHSKPCFIGEDGLVNFKFLDKSKSKSVLNWIERIDELEREIKWMEEFKSKLLRGDIEFPGLQDQ